MSSISSIPPVSHIPKGPSTTHLAPPKGRIAALQASLTLGNVLTTPENRLKGTFKGAPLVVHQKNEPSDPLNHLVTTRPTPNRNKRARKHEGFKLLPTQSESTGFSSQLPVVLATLPDENDKDLVITNGDVSLVPLNNPQHASLPAEPAKESSYLGSFYSMATTIVQTAANIAEITGRYIWDTVYKK